jgi:integrase
MKRESEKGFEGVFSRKLTHKYGRNYDVAYDICWQEDGKKRWKTVGRASIGVTAESAQTERLAILAGLKNPKTKDPTIREVAELWLASNRSRQRETVCRQINEALGDSRLSELRDGRLAAFKDSLIGRGLAPKTVNISLDAVTSIINHAEKAGLWEGPNWAGGRFGPPRLKTDNMGERYLTPEEAKTLLKKLGKHPWWRDAAALSLMTGIRLTEIYKLKAADLDPDRKFIMLRSKTGRLEPLLLTPEAAKIIRNRIAWHHLGDGLVFGRADNRPFLKTVRGLGWNERGMDRRRRVWFHTLRHTFASWLVQGGADIYSVQKLMRHKSIVMTQRYAHLGAEDLRRRLDIIRGIIVPEP